MVSRTTSLPTIADDLETAAPVRLGAGSFATVFVISGGPVVYKQVHTVEHASTLLDEYNTLDKIYSHCHTDSFFAIPRALAFNNPLAEYGGFITSTPSPPSHRRRRADRPIVTPAVMHVFDAPVYAMDRVHALPLDVRNFLKEKFFPPAVNVGPALCRLYFGKKYPIITEPKFVNSQNFPLDADRYAMLRSYLTILPPASEVAEGMGEMLGRMHNVAGVDARDVEFVLGGDGSGGYTFFIIDFNQASLQLSVDVYEATDNDQVRKWSKVVDDVGDIVQPFFANDPYYPRPRPGDDLYEAFKSAYLAQYGSQTKPVGLAFLQAIEREQASRDARHAGGA
ncbi:hypothetical protein BN946_scf184536.g2 [Trametes cinnabarina]|uniref:DUF3669 domain-containing protein n=1 Tax=Pycnoporus cinnabarinus TaxID=5643 RepID=A0A060SIC7_PYCCI|nr:hypothetical protein BN946_scf184536.g2 [Trametes cinnabarina]